MFIKFLTLALVTAPILSCASSTGTGTGEEYIRHMKSKKRDEGIFGKAGKEVCLEYGVLYETKGSVDASFPNEIVGISQNRADHFIGSQWTVNGDNESESYNAIGEETAVAYTFTEEYASKGDGSLCIENRCSISDCNTQKGYLQFFYGKSHLVCDAGIPLCNLL